MKNGFFFLSLVFFTLAFQELYGQSAIAENDKMFFIQNGDSRVQMSLDGQWDIIVDPLATGYYTHRFTERKDGFFMDRQIAQPDDLVEYNFKKGMKLQVPGDWNSQSDKLYYYENTIWYKKDFKISKREDKRYFIHFGAINYNAVIYLNRKKIAIHEGGYSSFDVEATEDLIDGSNLLIIKVENIRKPERIPTMNMDWWNYGGITRSVGIIETPETFISDYFIAANRTNKTEINGWLKLNGSNIKNKQVTIRIDELNVVKKVVTDTTGTAKINFSTLYTLWSPENPKLYSVSLESSNDIVTEKIGFRTITTNGDDILLNGKSIFLRGVSIHEEAPFSSGRVTTIEQCKTLLGWAKELGCNYVRLAHYPHSSMMVKAAEEMGLLVWSEIPVYWTVQFNNNDVLQLAKQQLFEMITRDKNRSNIILWSIANETPAGNDRLSFLKELSRYARELDNTRLITAALDTQTDEAGFKLINDPLGEFLDVIGINSYCGWYGGKPGDCKDLRWKSKYNKPLIMSEFGAGAQQGLHGNKNERWTEEYMDDVYTNNLDMLTKISFLRGCSPWILTDFRSPRRVLPGIQDDYNRKGLISNKGIRKKSFFTMQNFYKKLESGEINFWLK